MSRRNVFALVAVVCGFAAVLGAVLLLTTDRSTTVSENVLVQGATRIDAINSPTVLRNPKDSSNRVLTYRVDRPNFSAVLQYSEDSGKTWTATELPLPNGTPACTATIASRPCPFGPDIAFDNDGKLYVLYVNLVGNGNAPANLWLSTSTDGGKTLTPPVRIAGELTFQARLAVAPDGTIHITWLQGKETGLLSLLGANPIVTVRSNDGGQTFTQPVVISDPERVRVGGASPAVDNRGNLTVLYEDFKGDRRDFENLEGPVFEDPFALVITRSIDGGQTWTRGNEFESGLIPARRFLVYLPESPSLAVEGGGTIYAAWADGRNGDEDVFVKRSSDGGESWSEALRVNTNPVRDQTAQYLPKVAVNDDGRVEVLFYDRRNDKQNIQTEVFFASSTDGGNSFTDFALSSVAFDSRVGPSASLLHGTDFGTRLGLDAWGNQAAAAWTDTREGNEADGAQDIGTATVSLAGSTPFLGQWPVILGLFVIGAASLFVAMREARRPPPAVEEVKEAVKK
ncbi:MAG: sialidase family protein [Acidimicrobiales bacterium]